jgi:hypothetical protein
VIGESQGEQYADQLVELDFHDLYLVCGQTGLGQCHELNVFVISSRCFGCSQHFISLFLLACCSGMDVMMGRWHAYQVRFPSRKSEFSNALVS